MKAKNNVTVQDQNGNSAKPLLPAVYFFCNYFKNIFKNACLCKY